MEPYTYQEVRCGQCRQASHIFLKQAGHRGYVWLNNCDGCARFAEGVNLMAESKDFNSRLGKLYDEYMQGGLDNQDVLSRVKELAESAGIKGARCECGGAYTFWNPPICYNCGSILAESCFHFVDVLE